MAEHSSGESHMYALYAVCCYAECRGTCHSSEGILVDVIRLNVVAPIQKRDVRLPFLSHQISRSEFKNFYQSFYKLLVVLFFERNSYEFLTNFFRTSCQFLAYFLQTFYEFLTNFLRISYKLFMNFLWNSFEFLTNFLWISCFLQTACNFVFSNELLGNFWLTFNNVLTYFLWITYKLLMNFIQTSKLISYKILMNF